MSKVHTAVKVREDDSLVLPAFIMRGMGYEPGEEVPVTTPTDQYICDCDANNLPAGMLAEASIPLGEDISVLAADGALIIVPATEELRELPAEFCCLLNDLGISPLSIRFHDKWCLP